MHAEGYETLHLTKHNPLKNRTVLVMCVTEIGLLVLVVSAAALTHPSPCSRKANRPCQHVIGANAFTISNAHVFHQREIDPVPAPQ